MVKIISVNNNKGGTAKTTTVSNLSAVLARQGKKVLIIDADNQANIAVSFGQNPDDHEIGLYNVLLEGLDPVEAIVEVHENIHLLPANDDLIRFDFEVIGDKEMFPERFTIMKETCESLKDKYDYILIDTPPSLSLMVGNVFTFSDAVLVPYSPEGYSMRSLTKVLETIEDFRHRVNPDLKLLGVVATMISAQTNVHQYVLQQTREYCRENEIHLFETYIPRSVRFSSSVVFDNKPAALLDKPSEMAHHYFELWKEIEEHEGNK